MGDPSLLNDGDATLAREDLLGRDGVEATLATALRTLPTPGCVALYGSWGVGKTTLLRRAYATYEKAHPGCAVWFDPWEYERRTDLLSPLLHALVKRLPEADVKERIWKVARGVAKTLASLALQVGLKKQLDLELELEDIEKQFDNWNRYHDELVTLKSDFKKLVDLALEGKPNSRLVFFLDDLDRCLPDGVVEVLEGIKLLLCGASNCRALFVFALDRQVVGDAIAGRYPGASAYSGETYLEKIFDLSLEIPHADAASVAELMRRQWHGPIVQEIEARFGCLDGFRGVAEVLQASAFANPRVIKRVANRLLLLLRSQETRDFVAGLPLPERARLLTWIAGAERFRGFRHAFVASSEEELLELFQALRESKPFVGGVGLTRVVGLPDLRWYVNELGLLEHVKGSLESERSRKPGHTLGHYDARMRAAGL